MTDGVELQTILRIDNRKVKEIGLIKNIYVKECVPRGTKIINSSLVLGYFF